MKNLNRDQYEDADLDESTRHLLQVLQADVERVDLGGHPTPDMLWRYRNRESDCPKDVLDHLTFCVDCLRAVNAREARASSRIRQLARSLIELPLGDALRRHPVTAYSLALAVVVVVCLFSYALFHAALKVTTPAQEEVRTVTPMPESVQAPIETLTEELDVATRERIRAIAEQRGDLERARVATYAAAVEELTPDQRQRLRDRVPQEHGNQKKLLVEILDRDAKIRELRTRIEELATSAPPSHVAVAGDRHFHLAMDYLLAKGVPADAAYQLISKQKLADALIPGFRVWMYYDNGQFGTWVTQGTAGISPVERQRRLREETMALSNEEGEAIKIATRLRETNARLSEQVETGSTEASAALAAVEQAARERSEIVRASTVRYAIGTKQSFERSGIIDDRLRLVSQDLPDAQTLNLNDRRTVIFEPLSYDPKLVRVTRIRLAPLNLVEGTDYSVKMLDDVGVQLRILDTKKFLKAGRFIIVIE